MRIESTTKSGSKVIISGTPSSDVKVTIPQGDFTGYWGDARGTSGIICRGKVNGKEMIIVVQVPKADWDAFRSGVKAELRTNVPGLEELKKARSDESIYADEFDKMMNDESNDGVFPPKKPIEKSSDVAEQYPVAAAYIKAEAWEYADHYAKSAAGRKAKAKIAEGEDYKAAIVKMEKEWSDHCKKIVD